MGLSSLPTTPWRFICPRTEGERGKHEALQKSPHTGHGLKKTAMIKETLRISLTEDSRGKTPEKAMPTHSSTLAWKIQWTEEPGRLQSVHGVAKSRTRLGDFTFTFHFHAWEKEMATHSSVLAWGIPGTGESGGLLPMGSHRVRRDWSDLAAAAGERLRNNTEGGGNGGCHGGGHFC